MGAHISNLDFAVILFNEYFTPEIAAIEDMTCLTVTHGSFKTGSTMVKKVSGGWPKVLSSLKTFLETGKGLNIFCK